MWKKIARILGAFLSIFGIEGVWFETAVSPSNIVFEYHLPEGANMKLTAMLKQPSGFLPITMSLAAIVEIILYLAIFGITQQEDEGIAAHIFQLLIVLQLPIMMFFAAKWLPQFPKQAIFVLSLQIGAIIAAVTPILILEW